MATPLYSIDQIRTIERTALAELPPGTLMQRAGQAAADFALKLVSAAKAYASILVLAGPGNNGGDALEAAAILAQSGIPVTVWLLGGDERRSAESSCALERARRNNIEWISETENIQSNLTASQWALVIDGLFGIGLKQAVSGKIRELIETVNTLSCPVLALDNPSGLDADTGAIAGENGIAVRATHTITFIGDKPGLHTLHGRDHAGDVYVDDLGVHSKHFPKSDMQMNAPALFDACLRPRLHESHKGSYGNVVVLGGSHGMTGAPILAARAALHGGAGRVYVAFPDEPLSYDALQSELMFRQAQTFDFSSAIAVAGPGLGNGKTSRDALERVLSNLKPIILDADALNLIAEEPAYKHRIAKRSAGTLMTPHPLEAARLLGVPIAQIQSNRIEAARKLAQNFTAVVVLKGSGTVIASPDRTIVINPTGNPALATAGTGDVLAGICGALQAQNWPLWKAALGAVWVHGSAADELVRQGIGPIGLTAGELIIAIRTCLNKLVTASSAETRSCPIS